jgi:heme/copper-type cytochrome/quinol oxidase subunit 2
MSIESMPPNKAAKHLWKQRAWISLFASFALLILMAPVPLPESVPMDRHIRIEASLFQFTPAELQINPGDRVTVELVSTDVVHGFSLDGYDFELKADPGQTTTGTFVADQAGVFRFRCSVACGNLHPFMIGKLQIGPNLLLVRGMALGLLAILAALWFVRGSSTAPTRISV